MGTRRRTGPRTAEISSGTVVAASMRLTTASGPCTSTLEGVNATPPTTAKPVSGLMVARLHVLRFDGRILGQLQVAGEEIQDVAGAGQGVGNDRRDHGR